MKTYFEMKEILDFNVSGNLQPGRTCFDNIRKIMKQFSSFQFTDTFLQPL